MTKLIYSLALKIPHPLIFIWIATSIAEVNAIIANSAVKFFTEETPTYLNQQVNLPNKAGKHPHDWMVLDNRALLSFISIDIISVIA